MIVLDIAQIIEAVTSAATLLLAVATFLSIREIRRDRRLRHLEKRIEEFYNPLIKLFSHGTMNRGPEEHRLVEEIITSKRYLCGAKLAKILPQHFTEVLGSSGPYFEFLDRYDLEQWLKVADVLWEEFIEVLKEHYRITSVKEHSLPEKPRWMLKLAGKI